MNTRRLIMIAYLCFTFLSAHAQKNVQPCPGTIWTNRVQRTVYLDTTIKHTMADTSLAEVLTKLVLDKKLTAYATFDNRFTTKLSREKILENVSSHADDVNQQEDPVTGSTNTRVVMHEFNYNTIRAYRLVEEWQYNVDEGKIDIKILGISPVVDVYGDEGNYRGSVGMYWLKYEDAKDAIAQFNTQHPKDNLNKLIWRSYCDGDAVPFNNGNIQTGVTSRTVIVQDTAEHYMKWRLENWEDSSLSEILLTNAEYGKIPAFDTGLNMFKNQLTKDYIRLLLHGERYYEFNFFDSRYYILNENVTLNFNSGHLNLDCRSITIRTSTIDNKGNNNGIKSLMTFKYADIKHIINRYTMQHPFCNLPLALWRGYFTERE